MNAAAGPSEVKNPKTDMTNAERKEFIRNHFEEFVNRKNLHIGAVNFAPGFVDHGAEVPPGLPPGPAGAIAYVAAALKKVPDFRVTIEDMSCVPRLCRPRRGVEAAARILWNCNLEDRQPADRGALGLPGESSLRARLGLGV